MALINLNIDSLKKDSKGILNKLADNVVNKIESKLENAVEDLFSSALKKAGLSDNIAQQLSTRFGDSFSVGMADKYFQSSTSEQNRLTPQEICENVLPRSGAETTGEAFDRISKNNNKDIGDFGKAVYQYPQQLGKYFFSMKFADYIRPAPQVRASLKLSEAFILPLPRELKESFDIHVSEKDQNMAGGIADAATAYFSEGSGGKYDIAKTAETLLLSKLVQMAGDFGDAAGQFAGAVPNPHVSAIFSGIGLRSHRFEWTFAPRNQQESRDLQALIFKLKANALPSYSTVGTAALQYPQLVQIDLYPWANDGEANKLIRFKPCLLRDVSVNYSPQGIPSFFAGTTQPTFIQLSLEFLETEIWTGDQFDRAGTDRVAKTLNTLTDAIGGPGALKSLENTINSAFGQGNGSTNVPDSGKTSSSNPSTKTSNKQTASDIKVGVDNLTDSSPSTNFKNIEGKTVTVTRITATGGMPSSNGSVIPYGGFKAVKDGKIIATASTSAELSSKLAGQLTY